MGLTDRITTLVKQRVNTLLDKYEDPKEALDYSYQKQIETLNQLRRSIAEVVTAKKRLEMQKLRLWDNIRTLEEQSCRGFNSGWVKIQGIWQTEGKSAAPGPVAPPNPSNLLVDFGGSGKYRAPEFSWLASVAPTALTFLNSSKLGKQYENDMFVADVLYGNIYDFKLNQNRTGFLLNGPLDDKVANTPEEDQPLIFAQGFGGITDIQVGPDGYLYVLSYTGGAIYRIVPSS